MRRSRFGHRRRFTADSWGRKPTIIGASLLTILIGIFYPFIKNPAILMMTGFTLIIPIYVLVASCLQSTSRSCSRRKFGCERRNCNTFGRGAIIFTPFIVIALFKSHGVGGVLVFMIGLLVVEILVVLTLGVEPKKRRLEEIEAEPSVTPFPAEVRNP